MRGPPQPALVVALQVAASITDTVGSSLLPTYTVCVRLSTTTGSGKPPTATVGGDCAQPAMAPAWQVAALIIDTALSSASAT